MSINKEHDNDASEDGAPVPAQEVTHVLAEDGAPEPAEVTPVLAEDGAPEPVEVTPAVPALRSPPTDLESNNDLMPPPPVVFKLQPRNENTDSRTRFSKKQLGIAGAIFLTICLVLIFSLTLGGGSKNDKTPAAQLRFCLDKPSTNNPNPTDADPSAACTVLDNDELMDISDSLFGDRVCPCQSEENCCTAEEKALAWMIRDTFDKTLAANTSVSIDNRKTRMRERFALVHLYYQTRLDARHSFSYLSESDHCNFAASSTLRYDNTFSFVEECDSENRVQRINVDITRFYPKEPGVPIPATIGEFSMIQELNLKANLAGSIPSNIGLLSKLERLSLKGQKEKGKLIGAVPTEIGNLVSLKVLDLASNRLTAKLPTEIGKLASLEKLSLSENQIADPFPVEVNQLSNLTTLHLSNNPLSVVPPEIKNMSGLETLKMTSCSLRGSLSGINYPSSLTNLHLYNNKLSGTIEIDIGLLTKLENLDISNNKLVGPLPLELFELANLVDLRLQENPLNASIPTEIGNLMKLTNFYANGCSLTGVIPTEISLLTALDEADGGKLFLNDNALTGSVPPLPGRYLYLQNNKLNGQISPELSESLSNAKLFYAGNNELDGQIPTEIGLLTSMVRLTLTDNNLEGPIPTEIGLLSEISLFDLTNNANLNGPIPTEIGNLSKMIDLKLNDCSLTGSVPTELGLLGAKLTRLQLQNNQLTGEIPTELNALSSLTPFDISGNLLSDMALTDICKNFFISPFGKPTRKQDLPTFIAECNICENAVAYGCCKSCV